MLKYEGDIGKKLHPKTARL